MMKRLFLILFLIYCATKGFAQIFKIDDGPIYDHLRYVPSGARWNKLQLTYYIHNTSSHLTFESRQLAIQNAFQTWSDVSTLTFIQVSSPDSADIKLKWVTGNHGDGHPFDGPSHILAHAFFPPPLGGSNAGQVHFDDDEEWATDGSHIDLESIAVHEIGHALGLDHSSD